MERIGLSRVDTLQPADTGSRLQKPFEMGEPLYYRKVLSGEAVERHNDEIL
jgi:hypothetical protein